MSRWDRGALIVGAALTVVLVVIILLACVAAPFDGNWSPCAALAFWLVLTGIVWLIGRVTE